MPDKVVKMLNYLIENRDGYKETVGAVLSAMDRPYLLTGNADHPKEQIAAWFIMSLALEGYSIVKTPKE